MYNRGKVYYVLNNFAVGEWVKQTKTNFPRPRNFIQVYIRTYCVGKQSCVIYIFIDTYKLQQM